FLFSMNALASVSVTVVRPYVAEDEDTVYFADSTLTVDTAAGFRAYEQNKYRTDSDASDEMMYFDIVVSSPPAIAGNQTLVIMAQAYGNGSSDAATLETVSIA